jgi:hypothetical protein
MVQCVPNVQAHAIRLKIILESLIAVFLVGSDSIHQTLIAYFYSGPTIFTSQFRQSVDGDFKRHNYTLAITAPMARAAAAIFLSNDQALPSCVEL